MGITIRTTVGKVRGKPHLVQATHFDSEDCGATWKHENLLMRRLRTPSAPQTLFMILVVSVCWALKSHPYSRGLVAFPFPVCVLPVPAHLGFM